MLHAEGDVSHRQNQQTRDRDYRAGRFAAIHQLLGDEEHEERHHHWNEVHDQRGVAALVRRAPTVQLAKWVASIKAGRAVRQI